jgi:hypothetical protein
VEFAVEDGVPYAIDFMNPAPDADVHSVGEANFRWIVNAVAEMAVEKAQIHAGAPASGFVWSSFLSGQPIGGGETSDGGQETGGKKTATKGAGAKKATAPKPAAKKSAAAKTTKPAESPSA